MTDINNDTSLPSNFHTSHILMRTPSHPILKLSFFTNFIIFLLNEKMKFQQNIDITLILLHVFI